MKHIIKSALLAWGLPLGMLGVIYYFGLDSSRSLDSFNRSRFKPVKKEIVTCTNSGRSGSSDYFELWLEAPDHSRYFIRDPKLEPIDRYYRNIPDGELIVSYKTVHEGDRIVNVMVAATGDTPIAFTDIMTGERPKKRLVWLFALIFSTMGHIFMVIAFIDWREARRYDKADSQ